MVTLAVLRNNHTMEAITTDNTNTVNTEGTEEEERPRKRLCRHRVRFSEAAPQTFTFNNFEAMTEMEVQQVRERVWYTRQEFDSFLEDRLHTIRMWRAVHGNTRLIEPYYCIRGLEMYESAQLNGNVLAARAAHIRAVLQEQARQRAAQQPLDWAALAKSVATRSAWAMRQASRLALKDAMEAQEVWEMDATGFCLGKEPSLAMAPLKRLSMPFTGGDFSTCSSMSRRLSLPMGSLYNATSSHTTQRATVDVHKLKEMNRQFLKSMAGFQGTTTTTTSANNNNNCANTCNSKTPTASHTNSLALMLVRGRRLAIHNNCHTNGGVENQNRRLAGLAQEASLSLGHGLRRDSLHGLIRDSTADL